jgi:hypothetical protein
MACLQHTHSGTIRERRRQVAVRGDHQSALEPAAERVRRALHHRGGRLAHREATDPARVPATGERRAHAAPPVDRGQPYPEQVEQQRAARINVEWGVHR